VSSVLAVLDTNIIVSALFTPGGNSAKIYQMFLARSFDLVVSAKILKEYESVLYRPKLKISSFHVGEFLAAVRQQAEIVQPVTSTDTMPK
jgi:putative PIN family toxin of toxin-antitoxin system